MIDLLQSYLAPWYLELKFLHLLFVGVWMFSTSVAYVFYLLPVMKAWRRNPEDREILTLRNWVMERFDEGAVYEHVAFPMILITGSLLYIAGGWNYGVDWLNLKLLIVLGLFLPMELFDYYLSHFGGNNEKIRISGNAASYEQHIQMHWMFFLVSTPMVMIYGVLVLFLAITKPL